MNKLLYTFLAFIITITSSTLWTSCSNDSDCSLAGRAMMNCTFYKINPSTQIMMNDTLDSLTITALGTDSVILNNQKKVHTVSLPLRYTGDSTVFVFHYAYKIDPKICDTVYIKQKNTPYFESMECGYTVEQTIEKATHSDFQIDSLYIRTIYANTDETENLQIFYRYRD